MSEYKSHKVRISHLPAEKTVCLISTKTAGPIIAAWATALVWFLHTEFRYLCIPFAFVALVLSLRHGVIYFRGCESYFVIYNPQDPQQADLIYFSEVNSWEYRVKKDGRDYMVLVLQDGEKLKITEGVNMKMYRYFQNRLGSLEMRTHKPTTA